MSYLYSLSTKSFYINGIHKNIPTDAVEISDAEHSRLMEGQTNGQLITTKNNMPTLEMPPEQSLVSKQSYVYRALENDMHNYIYKIRGFTQGTQSTLQVILFDQRSSESQKNACMEIFDWIKEDVLTYYYSKKNEIAESQEPENIMWDFATVCDSSVPSYSLSQIIEMKE